MEGLLCLPIFATTQLVFFFFDGETTDGANGNVSLAPAKCFLFALTSFIRLSNI